MKKRVLTILLTVTAFFCVGLFSSCGNSNNNRVPPLLSSQLLPAHLISFGSYLSWDAVNNAESYDVYEEGIYVATTTQTDYQTGELASDTEYYVIAKNGGKQSLESNTVTVSKNCNFASDEVLDLTGTNTFNAYISPTIRKVIIGKDYVNSFDLSAKISERTCDLIFELHNVEISGSIFTHDETYSRTKNDYSVVFDLVGNCSIKGDDGKNGDDYSDKIYNDSEKDATNGTNGKDTIIVPTVVVTGHGDFTVFGGNGGKGGVGASNSTWSQCLPGKGADGGDGGTAIKTSYLVVNMDIGVYTVSVIDGKGGEKGKPGNCNSITIITKTWVSLLWNSQYDIGKFGSDGRSVLGTRKIIKGELVF